MTRYERPKMTDHASCRSCERESPYENHGWLCTRGPECVEFRLERIGTHAPDCWSWGPRHYECLKRKYETAVKAEGVGDMTDAIKAASNMREAAAREIERYARWRGLAVSLSDLGNTLRALPLPVPPASVTPTDIERCPHCAGPIDCATGISPTAQMTDNVFGKSYAPLTPERLDELEETARTYGGITTGLETVLALVEAARKDLAQPTPALIAAATKRKELENRLWRIAEESHNKLEAEVTTLRAEREQSQIDLSALRAERADMRAKLVKAVEALEEWRERGIKAQPSESHHYAKLDALAAEIHRATGGAEKGAEHAD